MKQQRLKLALGSDKTFVISIPTLSLRGLTRSEKLVKVLLYSLLFFLGFWVFYMPISILLYDPDFEYVGFEYLIIGMLVLFALYLGVVTWTGKKFVKDPPGFLVVLLFSLAVTAASVSVTPAHVTNTFGTSFVKGIAGLTVMAFLGLFYFVNVFVGNARRFKDVLKALTVGFVIYLGLMIVDERYGSFELLMLGFAIPLFLAGSTYSQKYRYVLFPLSLVAGYLLYDKFFQGLDYIEVPYSGWYALVLFVVTFTLSVIYALVKKDFLIKNIKLAYSAISSLFKGMRYPDKVNLKWGIIFQHLVNWVIFVTPIVLLIYIILLIDKGYEFKPMIEDIGLNIKDSWLTISEKLRADFSLRNLKDVVIGLGATSMNPSWNFYANILSAQGLVGFVAYLGLFSFGIFKGLKLFVSYVRENQIHKLISSLVFILLFVPLISLFAYLGITTLTLWWLAFALVISFENFRNAKSENVFNDRELKVGLLKFRGKSLGKYSYVIRGLLSLVIILLAIFFVYSFEEVLRDL